MGTDLTALKPGSSAPTCVHTPDPHTGAGETVEGMLTCVSADEYRLSVSAEKAALAATWLRDLSDGYILFDESVERIMPGPVVVAELGAKPVERTEGDCCNKNKPYFLSMCEGEGEALPSFEWTEPAEPPLRRTPLYQAHKDLGAKVIPFAGWEMPVWYTSVIEEHLATRQAAGLFDVAHMGVYSVEGADAASFLDTICGNDCGGLAPGESLYSQFLTPDAEVIDDTLIYRRAYDKYLVVVNASNDDKDRTWFEVGARWQSEDRQQPPLGADLWLRGRHPQPARPESGRRHARGHRPARPEEPRYAAGDGRGRCDPRAHHEAETHRIVRCCGRWIST